VRGPRRDGNACNAGDDCTDRRCVAEWFVDCRADTATTGADGYCVDVRWSGQGTAACFNNDKEYYVCGATETCADENDNNADRYQGKPTRGSRTPTPTRTARSRRSRAAATPTAHPDRRRVRSAGPDQGQDPFSVTPIARYDRKDTLPSATRKCVCEDEPVDGCEDVVNELCRVDGDPAKEIKKDRKGQYAMKFISRNGGVIYDPAVKGVLFQPADIGLMTRALVEVCSAGRANGAGALSIKDGWRANDNGAEMFANYDKAMCSSSTYRVLFNTEEDAADGPIEYIKDKVGNTLRGKKEYVLHTPDFHVIPGSGFPTDNLRIGACDDFEIRFSNKYDMSEANLKKIEIYEISLDCEDEIGPRGRRHRLRRGPGRRHGRPVPDRQHPRPGHRHGARVDRHAEVRRRRARLGAPLPPQGPGHQDPRGCLRQGAEGDQPEQGHGDHP
jgi:hypothetical protein